MNLTFMVGESGVLSQDVEQVLDCETLFFISRDSTNAADEIICFRCLHKVVWLINTHPCMCLKSLAYDCFDHREPLTGLSA